MEILKIGEAEDYTCNGRKDCGEDVRVVIITESDVAIKLCYVCAKRLHNEIEDKLYLN